MEVSTSRLTQADQVMQDIPVKPNQQTPCNEPPRYDNHSSILTWGNLMNARRGQSTIYVLSISQLIELSHKGNFQG